MAMFTPETVGKMLAPIVAAAAPIIADRLAKELRDALPGIEQRFVDAVLTRLPDLSRLDDDIKGAVREVFNALPLPFKI